MPARRSRLVPADARHALAESLRALRSELDVPGPFDPEVLAEATRCAKTPAQPLSPEADLRGTEFLTIDPAGSRDLDQALHLRRTASGAVLHYAIADVPASVRAGGAVDREARRRGQTLYAPDGTVPLHPRTLSEDAVSLLPGADRRAFVWRFELDERAEPVQTSIVRGVIRSRAQWTYPAAQRAIDDGSAPESLAALPWFGAQRRAREAERGGASLNLTETRVVSADGSYRLERDVALPVEDANAQVSLLTGIAAASIMLAGGVGILRTMPPADDDDLAEFRARTRALGHPWPKDLTYGEHLRRLDPADPRSMAVREAAAELFRGAGYAAFDGEPPAVTVQAAIGAPYAHVTAPLRRLVDRWGLLSCEALAHGRDVPEWVRQSLPELPERMSVSGALASRLERESTDRVEAAVLHGREGELFEATVLAARNSGARVQLHQPAVTATVPGLAADPGSTVSLRLTGTDIATGTVEFSAA